MTDDHMSALGTFLSLLLLVVTATVQINIAWYVIGLEPGGVWWTVETCLGMFAGAACAILAARILTRIWAFTDATGGVADD